MSSLQARQTSAWSLSPLPTWAPPPPSPLTTAWVGGAAVVPEAVGPQPSSASLRSQPYVSWLLAIVSQLPSCCAQPMSWRTWSYSRTDHTQTHTLLLSCFCFPVLPPGFVAFAHLLWSLRILLSLDAPHSPPDWWMGRRWEEEETSALRSFDDDQQLWIRWRVLLNQLIFWGRSPVSIFCVL